MAQVLDIGRQRQLGVNRFVLDMASSMFPSMGLAGAICCSA
jgi:hypothetical protein